MAKVLVVDDRETNRELVVASLQREGHVLLQASDGAEALAIVRAERPQVVISDILMPTMDGYEFARQLRSDPEIAQTEIIFYTAHYRAREAENLAQACGVFRVLTKPCEPDDIIRAVGDALQSGPAFPVQVPREFSAEHVRLMADKLAEKTAEVRTINQRLAAQYELNLEFATQEDSHALLEHFCRGAREMSGAKYAVVAVNSGAPGAAPFFLVRGLDSQTVAGLKLPRLDVGTLGQVLSERRARQFSGAAADLDAMGLPRGLPAIRFALAAPIVSASEAYGWVCLADKPGANEFDPGDELFITKLAAQVGRIYARRLRYSAAQAELAALRTEVDHRREAARAGATLADKLNHNEREIVRLVAEGKSTTEVAEALNLSPRTVETYRARLMHKLGIEDLASLVKFAIRGGIAPLD